jgi:hypothetical protein
MITIKYEESLKENKNESAFISNKEKSMILDIFDKWDVIVLRDFMKDEMFEGNLYHNFVVETDEMSEIILGDLERDLYALEELKDIGYEKNYNRNGVNARTFYFYKFIN